MEEAKVAELKNKIDEAVKAMTDASQFDEGMKSALEGGPLVAEALNPDTKEGLDKTSIAWTCAVLGAFMSVAAVTSEPDNNIAAARADVLDVFGSSLIAGAKIILES